MAKKEKQKQFVAHAQTFFGQRGRGLVNHVGKRFQQRQDQTKI